VLLEYAKASFERIKQRFGHLWALARVKRVPNDYTLSSNLDRQFGDLPVGLRKILLKRERPAVGHHGVAAFLIVGRGVRLSSRRRRATGAAANASTAQSQFVRHDPSRSLSGRMSVGVQSDPTELTATQTTVWP
jgi:hypothetical protein